MKKNISLRTFAIFLILILAPIQIFSNNFIGVHTPHMANPNPTPVPLLSNESTFLYCSKALTAKGELAMQGGDNMLWKGNSELSWDINVPDDESYELFLIANVPKGGDNVEISFTSNEGIHIFVLKPTAGPYIGGRNFERIPLSSKISLKKGRQVISLSTQGITKKESLMDIRSIELLPISAKEKIKKEKLRAVQSRESVDWLIKSNYGLMFHWTSESVQPDGTIKSYEEAVNQFDVEKFAQMVEETGAGYVIFTIGHAESYCPAPIKSWEKRHPGKTTKRDLILEIADALNKKGVRLIAYINGPLAFKLNVKGEPTAMEKQDFVLNFKEMLSEIGNRYGNKIAGYWFDSWYQIFEEFPEVPFKEFNRASKLGNKNRIICLNSWIYPSVTPWQDYWAGEVASPIEIPTDGFMKNGPVTDLPYQALLIMEPYWVQQTSEMPEPRFDAKTLTNYIKECNKNKGAVTINLGIYQDGTVGKEALEVMKGVKRNIKEQTP
jgi:hypothetical protein